MSTLQIIRPDNSPAKPGFHARKAFIKNRLVAFKVLLALMDGVHPWLTVAGEGKVTVRLGPLARHVRLASARLREQLAWLESFGYLTVLELKRGEATVQLRRPRNLRWGQEAPTSAVPAGRDPA
jgi:hypothetical protein